MEPMTPRQLRVLNHRWANGSVKAYCTYRSRELDVLVEKGLATSRELIARGTANLVGLVYYSATEAGVARALEARKEEA